MGGPCPTRGQRRRAATAAHRAAAPACPLAGRRARDPRGRRGADPADQGGDVRPFFGAEPAAAPLTGTAPAAATATAPLVDLSRPFDSTPAQDWADGAAGIAAPAPEAVGGFSAEQVAAATALVRDVLVASRLDRRMVVDHDPSAFLDKLAPDARRQLEPLFIGGREPEVQSLVSLVSDTAKLLPAQAKVDGEMNVTAGDAGELVVHTNYVFVYAFEPQGPTRLVDAMNVLVVVRADVDYVLRAGDHWTASSQGLWYGDATGYAYSMGCETYRKGYLTPASTERAVTASQSREPATYFDPASPLPATSGCPA
ncbi:MAG: hypothetical protein GEV28_24655 [Actinophytocola sp.]|uniref:hypothetical protein n=1 Tax=Actinophytocola sp. TaxID=1872138 RepID=UPI00132890AC|nr:hypothetical protein [Actinophytocola sp.]MPZ83409.1 hypothetical protein [Actinophytocola sp.]